MAASFFDRSVRNEKFLIKACYEGNVDDVKDALDAGANRDVSVKFTGVCVANDSYYCSAVMVNLIVLTAIAAKGKNYKEPYRQIINLLLNGNPKIKTPAVQYEENDASFDDEFVSATTLNKGHLCSKTLQEVLDEQPKDNEKILINNPRYYYILDVDMVDYLKKQLENSVPNVAKHNDLLGQVINSDNVIKR